jgi:uncharacterized protein YutE (UPF0331/DUF86 family)
VADLERFLGILEVLREALATLERYRSTIERDRLLADVDVQNMVLYATYRAVQAAVDLAQHLVAERGLPVPTTYRETFRILADAGEIEARLAERLQGWAGLRNVIAHHYAAIDVALVADALYGDLGDLASFATEMARKATSERG